MINKELFYKVTLIDCNGKELEVAKFLQILTGNGKNRNKKNCSEFTVCFV